MRRRDKHKPAPQRYSIILLILPLALLHLMSGCTRDRCIDIYSSCTKHERCRKAQLPPGLCLDDGETGRICAYYFHSCPTTMLQWDECGGNNGRKSSWAGRCVRPAQIPDFGVDAGADASPPPPDLSAEIDAPGPS